MSDRSAVLAEISEVFYDYAEAADAADPVAFADLFTEDCRFDRGRPVPNRAWIEHHAHGILAGFRETSHHISAIRLRNLDGDVAQATAYVYAWHRLTDGNTFVAMGHYESTLRRNDGRWRFAEHAIVLHGNVGTDGRRYLRHERADLSAALAAKPY